MTGGMTDDVGVLESVLQKTELLIAGTRPDQGALPTPCPDYDVATLVDHLVGWVQVFAAGAAGEQIDVDPATFHVGPRPDDEFRAAAARTVQAFRDGAAERAVSLGHGELPGAAVLGMMLMEYVGHGWDLATATGQPVPFDDAEARAALSAGRGMLSPDYRGPDKAFGHEVTVPDDAGSVEQLVAFLGRNPR